MLRPFVAYLRVYEPLLALGDPPDPRLLKAVETAELTRTGLGRREQEMWLKSQTALPVRLLPAELADGRAAPSTFTDILVLHPNEGEGEGPLICPLELRARSAASLVTFLADAHPALRNAVLDASGATNETVRGRAVSALSDLAKPAAHMLTTTWTVPLPWFALIDPPDRRLNLGTGQYDQARELSWRTPIEQALDRATEATHLLEATFGDSGPSRVLQETTRWLENFAPGSVVELDYGGIVQLLSNPILESDTTAEEVHEILKALRTGNPEELTTLFADLREFWSEVAAREHAN
ncbi:hypothetical protein [Amycolatopsis sp. H20-H5]|uniref:hypothetical protein n=1 Tax=Amycolatopsis sp. H20-H5 TaxID=3046309 RepID=UPI002DBAF06E|nr:hypothetical protein [Amycolatopsis sp. H20-H5]MEC3977025.1 hypothetical protein [Amycolatopsis sp. H20-H5]